MFGGVLRDIALFGISKLDSDIDLVYLGATETIGTVVTRNGFKFKENKFGGLRVETKSLLSHIFSSTAASAGSGHPVAREA